jgi:[protein-PII] uridylyltransferase
MLRPPLSPPAGHVLLDHSLTSATDFSSWLSLNIENRFRQIQGWEEAAPIAIGSWGRGELCPGSDLDVIFCGETQAIRRVILEVEKLGLKLRHRTPENELDWSQGVGELEVNALFKAKALTLEAAEKLQRQKDLILEKGKTFRRQLLKEISRERRERFKRYDSIANFIEPNLKFGAGGLRDLEQALILADWFPERFVDNEYSFKVLDYYKYFFLMIRQKLHLNSGNDQLSAPYQHELVNWFGFANHRDFMKEVQKGLSRVSFHSDWTIERCQMSLKKLKAIDNTRVESWSEAQRHLHKNSSLQLQGAIRKKLYESKGFKKEKLTKVARGRLLKKILDIKQKEDFTHAAFRSQMVSHLIPHFTDVVGLVQHDQYHRFSVDAHLLQAVHEVKRLYTYPKLFGKLQFYAEKLNLTDWNILRWAALYHDIAKGKKGEHSKVGRDLVLKDLKSFGLPKDFVQEVAWIVENHLILSTAAFRKNPQSSKTLDFLFDRGVKGKRVYRLAIFTVIDIIATNPEAWNTWKESLIYEIVESLRNPSRERNFEFSKKVRRKNNKISALFLSSLDNELIEHLPQNTLIKDFSNVADGRAPAYLVCKDKRGRAWVRYHQKADQTGIVLMLIKKLTNLGCNIRQAFIYTDIHLGVYDWFCVKSQKSAAVLRKQLLLDLPLFASKKTLFSEIDLISAEDNEWVFSFRAKDKKGLLLSAIECLHDENLHIIWAKVHTWGRQIDDIFGVVPKPDMNASEQLNRLKEKLEEKELVIYQ